MTGELTGHLRRVGYVVVDQLTPNGRHGRQVIVWLVDVFVHGQGNVAGAGQEDAFSRLARNAHTLVVLFPIATLLLLFELEIAMFDLMFDLAAPNTEEDHKTARHESTVGHLAVRHALCVLFKGQQIIKWRHMNELKPSC